MPHRDEPNRATRYEYATIARITLFSTKNGFFGRTYQSSHISLDPNTLKPVGDHINEFVLFYIKFKDSDMQAVIEFVLVIKEKSAKQQEASAANVIQEEEKKESERKQIEEKKSETSPAQPKKILGIGFCVFPLYGEGHENLPTYVKIAELLQGSPRVLISG